MFHDLFKHYSHLERYAEKNKSPLLPVCNVFTLKLFNIDVICCQAHCPFVCACVCFLFKEYLHIMLNVGTPSIPGLLGDRQCYQQCEHFQQTVNKRRAVEMDSRMANLAVRGPVNALAHARIRTLEKFIITKESGNKTACIHQCHVGSCRAPGFLLSSSLF